MSADLNPGGDAGDPFAQFLSSSTSQDPSPLPSDQPQSDAAQPADADPFAKFLQPPEQDSGDIGSFLHSFERGVAPALGSLPAIGAGAEAGAEIGSVGGPVGAAAGGIIGGLAGGFVGSSAISAAQDWALKQLPESWQDFLGQSQQQQATEAEKHPTASYLGGVVPYLLTMKPGMDMATKALPENATALQRIMANPVTSHIFGGAVMGGMELGNETANHENPNWTNIAIATGLGVVFNKPNRVGERLIDAGAKPARALLGRPEPEGAATATAEPSPSAPVPSGPLAVGDKAVVNDVFQGEAAPNNGKPVTILRPSPDGSGYDVRFADGTVSFMGKALLVRPEPAATAPAPVARETSPTVAQAGDAKVLGPGITEDVFMGAHGQAPAAEMTAQDAARTETSTLNPDAGLPSAGIVARRMEPELFSRYDDLQAQRDDLLAHPDVAGVQQHIAATEAQLRDMAPEIAAAHRRAADVVQSPTVELETAAIAPNASAVAPEGQSVAGQRVTPEVAQAQAAAIAQEVTANLVAAGRSPEEAQASGQLLGHYYRTRAQKFGGALGSPMDLFRAQGPNIRRFGIAAAPLMPTAGRPNFVPEKPAAPAEVARAPTVYDKNAPGQPEFDPTKAAPTSELEAIDPATVGVDAKRFQFKEGGDEAGVSDRLQGVEKWDPRLAGTALVYRDEAGKNWVADGHQRFGLAKRLMEAGHPPIKVNSFVLDAKDGVTDSQARAIAAVKNIAEGTGTAIDAAKVLREAKDSGIDLPPMPPRSSLVRDGNALAELSPEAFGAVVNGVVPANQGAMVGRLVRDPADQVEAVRLLAKTKPDNAVQAEMMIRDMLASGTDQFKQQNLFGEEAFASSIVLERAKVAEESLKQLRRDKSTFSTLVNEAERIQGQGANVLDQSANQSRLTTDEKASDLLTQLAFRAGPVSDKLSEVARRLKAGDISAAEGAREFLGAVRSAVESGVDTGAEPRGAEPGAVGERGQELFQSGVKPAPWREGEMFGGFETERGLEGLPQTLIPGVKPMTDAERMAAESAQPLKGGAAPAKAGSLFDVEGREDAAAQGTLFQQKRGAIQFVEGRKPLIKLFADADASTFLHESGHQWLEDMMRDAQHPQAPDSVRDDAQTVRDWLGIKDVGDQIATRQHEKFARGFEQYMREGVAPSPGLARVFAQFKTWLTQIYQSIKGLGAPINEDIRGVFDRLLAEEPNRTVISPEREAEPSLPSIHEAEAETAAPHEAHGIGDRIAAERDAYVAQQSPEVQNELAAALAEQATADRAAAGIEPGAEAGPGAGGPAEVGALGGEPGAEPAGGARGGERGPELGGGGQSVQPSGAAESDAAGLRQQRPGAAGNAGATALATSPADLFGAKQSPFTDKAGNIVLRNLTSDQDVAQAIRDSAQENNDFVGERRGIITDGQVLDLADALGMNPALLNQRKLGEAMNAEQIVAARKLLIQSATDVSALMKRAAAGSDADLVAYAQAKAKHQMIQAQVAGITAEAGRALRAFRSLAGQAEVAGVDQFLRTATGKTLFQLKEEAKLGATLDSPMQVSKFINDGQKRGFGSMLLEYWINGLISGPATHTTYAVGNTILALQKSGPETAAAALIGRLRRTMGREGETVRLGEVGAQMRGLASGLPAATKAAIDALRTGVTTRLPGETAKSLPFQPGSEFAPSAMLDEAAKYSDAMPALYSTVQGIKDGIVSAGALLKAGGVDGAPALGLRYSPLGAIPDIAIKGVPVLPIGTLARLPSRGVASIHSFFRSVNYSMAKNALAYRSAAEAGLSGTAFDAHVADARQNPTPAMMEQARSTATQLTLMGNGSEFVQALSRLTNTKILGLPILKFIDPFVHIAGNVLDQSLVQRTPLGLLSPELRADLAGKNGNVAQDTAMARMLVGTALSVGFGSLAAQGLISGSGPSNPQDAAMWRLAGNQAHSVRIGDTWYQVNRLGPMGMLAGVAADMYDVAHSASQGDLLAAASGLQHAFTQNILDESFMRGPSELVQALDDPGRYGQAYIRNFLSSFVPYSVGLGQIARAGDPYSRQARSIMDAIKAKIPGMSETLQPRIDVWGAPIPSGDVLGPRGLSAIYASQISKDPVNLAMLQLGISPGLPERKIRGVQLTDEQYTAYSILAGRMAKTRLDQIVGSGQWQQWDPTTQHDVVTEVIRQSRETARGSLMGKYPQIVVQAVQNKLAALKGGN